MAITRFSDALVETFLAFAGFGLVLGLDFGQVRHGVIQSDLSLFQGGPRGC